MTSRYKNSLSLRHHFCAVLEVVELSRGICRRKVRLKGREDVCFCYHAALMFDFCSEIFALLSIFTGSIGNISICSEFTSFFNQINCLVSEFFWLVNCHIMLL